MSQPLDARRRQLPVFFHPAVMMMVLLFGTAGPTVMLKLGPRELPYRVAAVAVSAATALYAVAAMYFQTRSEDELLRKIQAEALSLAFATAIVVAFTGEYAEAAGLAGEIRWHQAWMTLLGLYFGAYYLVWLRYR